MKKILFLLLLLPILSSAQIGNPKAYHDWKWFHWVDVDRLKLTQSLIFATPTGWFREGDSYTDAGDKASPEDSAYYKRMEVYYALSSTNKAFAGFGTWRMVSTDMTAVNPGNQLFISRFAALNDLRRGGTDRRTLNKIINAYKACFVNHYLESYIEAGSGNASIVMSAGFSNGYTPNTIGGKSTAGAFTTTATDSIKYTFTAKSNVAWQMMAGDSVNQAYARGSWKIYEVGGNLVASATFTTNQAYDGQSDGSNNNQRGPMAFYYLGLDATKTYRLVLTSAQSTNVFAVDYFGHLVSTGAAYPELWIEPVHLNSTGYAAGSPTLNHASDAVIDAGIAVMDSLYADVSTSGYPVRLSRPNVNYNTTTMIDADGIHPNNPGHREIYQTNIAVFPSLVATVPEGSIVRLGTGLNIHFYGSNGTSLLQLDGNGGSGGGSNKIAGRGITDSSNYFVNTLRSGLSGGQIIFGGTANADGLTLTSTTAGTKGKINIGSTLTVDEASGFIGVNKSSPSASMVDMVVSAAGNNGLKMTAAASQSANLAEFYSSTPTLVAKIGPTGAISAGGNVSGGYGFNGTHLQLSGGQGFVDFWGPGGGLAGNIRGNVVAILTGTGPTAAITANANQTVSIAGNTTFVSDAVVGHNASTGDVNVTALYGSSAANWITFMPSFGTGTSTAGTMGAYFNGSAWKSAWEYSNTTGSAATNLLLLKGGGNVGVGTATPLNTLDVNGTLRVRTLTSTTAQDSILVQDNGIIKYVDNSLVIQDLKNKIPGGNGQIGTVVNESTFAPSSLPSPFLNFNASPTVNNGVSFTGNGSTECSGFIYTSVVTSFLNKTILYEFTLVSLPSAYTDYAFFGTRAGSTNQPLYTSISLRKTGRLVVANGSGCPLTVRDSSGTLTLTAGDKYRVYTTYGATHVYAEIQHLDGSGNITQTASVVHKYNNVAANFDQPGNVGTLWFGAAGSATNNSYKVTKVQEADFDDLHPKVLLVMNSLFRYDASTYEIAFMKLAMKNSNKSWASLSGGGERLQEYMLKKDEIIARQPEYVIFGGPENDAAVDIRSNMTAFIDTLQGHNIIPIYLQTSSATAKDSVILNVCNEQGIVLIPAYQIRTDASLHPIDIDEERIAYAIQSKVPYITGSVGRNEREGAAVNLISDVTPITGGSSADGDILVQINNKLSRNVNIKMSPTTGGTGIRWTSPLSTLEAGLSVGANGIFVQGLTTISAGTGIDLGYFSTSYGVLRAYDHTANGYKDLLLGPNTFIKSTGKIGLGNGTTNPTSWLTLPAGTTAANSAPLKFTTGTAMTTPEDGSIEYHSSHLYFTIGSTRFQLDQQGGGVTTADDNLKITSGVISTNTVVQTLTFGSTTTFTTANGVVAKLTATGNTTLSIPTPQDGKTYTLKFVQDGTGGRTITVPGGTTPNVRLGAGDSTLLTGIYFAATTGWNWFSDAGGMQSLNGLTDQIQTFATSTSGTNFTISSTGGVHTFNLPDAGTSARGLVTTATQAFSGSKTFALVGVGGATASSSTALLTPASTTSLSSIRITPSGAAPSSLVDGDIFSTNGEIWFKNTIGTSKITNSYIAVTATDANFSPATGAGSYFKLPDITANRTFNLPDGNLNEEIIIWNSNSAGFTWSVTGTGIINDGAGNTITSLVNDTVYKLLYTGSHSWLRTN